MRQGATVGAVWMLAAAWSAILPDRIKWKPASAVWVWNAVGQPGAFILSCRMLGCMGNSHWEMPCNDLHRMSLVVVVFLVEELILYVELM